MSYLHQILHGGQLFDIVEGHEKFLAIWPPWRSFMYTTRNRGFSIFQAPIDQLSLHLKTAQHVKSEPQKVNWPLN